MSERKTVRIEEIAEKIGMGPFGSNIRVSTFVPDGIPIVSGQHLHHFRLDERLGYNFISNEHADKLKNSNVFPGDIVFTHAGTIGQVSLIPEGVLYRRYVISQRQYYLRVDRSKADPAFIALWFHGPAGKHQLLMNASQVGVPSISRPITNLKSIEIELPSLERQKAISSTLNAFDYKIELNRKMNDVLEKIVKTIYHDWFIEFGPTRAKMDGRRPYLSSSIWKFFPELLDKGDIPLGWKLKTVSEIADFPKRTVKISEIDENLPYIGLKHMPSKSIALSEWEKASDVASNKSWFNSGEFLFGKLSPESHKVGIAPIDGVCSTDIVVVRPKVSHWYSFLISLLSSDRFVKYSDQTSTGTIMPRTNWKIMGEYKFVLPPEELISEFQTLTQPFLDRIQYNIFENRRLSEIFEFLLPRLVSGDIALKMSKKAQFDFSNDSSDDEGESGRFDGGDDDEPRG